MRALAALALLLASAGCAPTRLPLLDELAAQPATATHPRWPQPPQPTRIAFLGAIESERQLDPRLRVWRRIVGALTGDPGLRFVRPAALCLHGDTLVVADPGLGVVHHLDLALRRWSALGNRKTRSFRSPVGVACLPDGRVLVADSLEPQLRLFAADGSPLGVFGNTRFERPTGLAVDARRGRVWVADTRAHRVHALDLEGHELVAFGEHGAAPGELNAPVAVAASPDGAVWVTDALNFRVQRFAADGRFEAAIGAAGDAPGDFARPRGIALAAHGRLFAVDALFDAVQVFAANGDLLLVFGGRGEGAGQLWLPADVALDGANHVFVSDSYNRRVQVFAYSPPEDAP
jgi:DNA-binding beta-propeller fold protein YncE